MRFDARVVSLGTYFTILLFNVYALILYFNQQLTLYIHPRYVLFTAILNAFSLVACGVGFVLTAWRLGSANNVASYVRWRRPPFTVLVAGFVLVAAYALPAHTLSSDTADQRANNFNDVQPQPSSAGDTLALFAVETSTLSIPDWVSAFSMRTSASFYEGKNVDVVGFVFHPKGTPEDVFYVARFRLTCCAVDAQPLGVPVYSPGWQEKFKEDSWVHLTGTFTETDQDIAEPAVIEPQDIEPTEQPDNPYVT